jgi:hypothetical protein
MPIRTAEPAERPNPRSTHEILVAIILNFSGEILFVADEVHVATFRDLRFRGRPITLLPSRVSCARPDSFSHRLFLSRWTLTTSQHLAPSSSFPLARAVHTMPPQPVAFFRRAFDPLCSLPSSLADLSLHSPLSILGGTNYCQYVYLQRSTVAAFYVRVGAALQSNVVIFLLWLFNLLSSYSSFVASLSN